MIDKMRYKIIDNFLGDAEFIALTNNIFPIFDKSPNGKPDFPWIYVNQQLRGDYPEPDHLKKVTDIKLLNPIHDWYFTHIFWNGIYQSPLLGVIVPLLNKIDPLSLFRININFTVQQPERKGRSLFHNDYSGPATAKRSLITSIFYMNTTNGPTLLEDGTEIECRANRLVTYPCNTYHAGVLCTDQPHRCVINFNYFKDEVIMT